MSSLSYSPCVLSSNRHGNVATCYFEVPRRNGRWCVCAQGFWLSPPHQAPSTRYIVKANVSILFPSVVNFFFSNYFYTLYYLLYIYISLSLILRAHLISDFLCSFDRIKRSSSSSSLSSSSTIIRQLNTAIEG